MFDFLPKEIINALLKLRFEDIYEIRLRVDKPVYVNCQGEFFKLNLNGYQIDQAEMNSIYIRLTDHSVYVHQDSIKQGFVTTKFGVRVGLCGECVVDDEKVRILRQITSMCIRVPHEIIGCSDKAFKTIFYDGLKSVLIISPPSGGKTTLLRDLVRNISLSFMCNVLVVDERIEISGLNNAFFLGETTDVLSGATKEYGCFSGVKSLNPSVIAVDELMSQNDAKGVQTASLSGVKVIASVHGTNIYDVQKKQIFSELFENRIFDYAIVLKSKGKIESIKKLYI